MGPSRLASVSVVAALATTSFLLPTSQASRGVVRSRVAAAAKVTVLNAGVTTFRGTGPTVLGQVRLGRTATLSWLHPHGGRLQITTGSKRPFPLLSVTGSRGTIRLRRGTYNAMRVTTAGGWRVTLRITK